MRANYFLLICLLNFYHHSVFGTIHVFGDSHSKAVSQMPDSVNHWLGPITMHRVGRDGLSFLDFRNHGVGEGDCVVLVFGEIDVRCHIGKQRDQFFRPLDEVIDTLTESYFGTILANRNLFEKILIIVNSIIPPTNNSFNHEYPYYGTLEDRVFISKKLNEALMEKCEKYNILFLNGYGLYRKKDGSLRTRLSDGCVHIHPNHSNYLVENLAKLIHGHQLF